MIYIPKEEKQRVCALLCDFKFDIEHGLALVFENEKIFWFEKTAQKRALLYSKLLIGSKRLNNVLSVF